MSVRLVGVAVAAFGLLAAAYPDGFSFLTGAPASTGTSPQDIFAAVERRARAGMVLGVGLVLIAVPTLRPWSVSIPAAVLYWVTGVLAARLLGLVCDGAVPKQWFLVAVEALLMTLAALWLWRSTQDGAS
ncbi:MAG: DUF4345 family protein [Myxococcota bacterium]